MRSTSVTRTTAAPDPRRRRLRRAGARLALSFVLVTGAGCYHYRAIPNPSPSDSTVGGSLGRSTDGQSEIVWSFIWGAVQEAPTIDNCQGQDLAEVHVSSNFGFTLVTVLTLGFASPARVEWFCAKPRPTDDVIGTDSTTAGNRDSARADPVATMPTHLAPSTDPVAPGLEGTTGGATRRSGSVPE